MPFTFDSTGADIANYVTGEVHVIDNTPGVGSLMVQPTEETAFYKAGFIATGYNATYPAGLVLNPYKDYRYSPMYITYSAATGKEAFSYIVLQDAIWDTVELEYHGVGGDLDATLFAEIVAAGAFDRLNPVSWVQFVGQMSTLNTKILDPEPSSQTFLEVLNTKLAMMIDAINNLPAYPTPTLPVSLINDVADKILELSDQQVIINDALGKLGAYGAKGVALKLVTDVTYEVTIADIGKTLVFTNVAGCALTINNGLLKDFWFRIIRNIGAGNITYAGTATLFGVGSTTSTIKVGELISFIMTVDGTDPDPDIYILDGSVVLPAGEFITEDELASALGDYATVATVDQMVIDVNTVLSNYSTTAEMNALLATVPVRSAQFKIPGNLTVTNGKILPTFASPSVNGLGTGIPLEIQTTNVGTQLLAIGQPTRIKVPPLAEVGVQYTKMRFSGQLCAELYQGNGTAINFKFALLRNGELSVYPGMAAGGCIRRILGSNSVVVQETFQFTGAWIEVADTDYFELCVIQAENGATLAYAGNAVSIIRVDFGVAGTTDLLNGDTFINVEFSI